MRECVAHTRAVASLRKGEENAQRWWNDANIESEGGEGDKGQTEKDAISASSTFSRSLLFLLVARRWR